MNITDNIVLNYNSSSALRAFLDQEGLGMRKKFGQNFLINPQVRQSLVQALEAKAEDEVWEIGPGLGAMTVLLLEKGLSVKVFEIDNGFIRVLKNIFSHEKNFSLIEGDVMKTWAAQQPAPFLFGNLPYNTAAALLADFIEKGRIFSRAVVTVQKETALRMAAPAGSPDYSSFSVLCASVYKVKPFMLIKKESFFPQPNVESMGVLLERKSAPEKSDGFSGAAQYPDIFYPLIRSLFASRRKTVKNNLLTFLSSRIGDFAQVKMNAQELCAQILNENAISEKERAENLELDAFLSLAKSIDNMRLCKKKC